MQDLGATFGPTKLDIRNWRRTAVWNDARACRVSMEHLPFGGGTFPEQQISDEGRRFLLGLLRQLSARQLHELFVGSRVTAHDGVSLEGRSADAWVRAFQDKVQQIAAAGPCPT
jgi:hypothetical protein